MILGTSKKPRLRAGKETAMKRATTELHKSQIGALQVAGPSLHRSGTQYKGMRSWRRVPRRCMRRPSTRVKHIETNIAVFKQGVDKSGYPSTSIVGVMAQCPIQPACDFSQEPHLRMRRPRYGVSGQSGCRLHGRDASFPCHTWNSTRG